MACGHDDSLLEVVSDEETQRGGEPNQGKDKWLSHIGWERVQGQAHKVR